MNTRIFAVVIVGILLGLPQGAQGVAAGYSTALVVLLVPIAAWSKQGTGITWADLWRVSKAPCLAGVGAGAAGLFVKIFLKGSAPLGCLTIGTLVVIGVYAWTLLIVMRQKHVYMDLLSQLLPRNSQEEVQHFPSL